MDKDVWRSLIQNLMANKGKIIGGIIGLIFGILILTIGLLKTLLILILSILGYHFGSRWDTDSNFDLRKILDRLLPPRYR